MAGPAPTELGAALGALLDDRVVAMARVHGGDVARSFRVQLERGGTVFAKTNPNAPADAFTAEAAGLRWLAEPGVVPVPEVLAVTDGVPAVGEPNLLVLAWIEEGPGRPSTEADLGRSLAALHQTGAPCFGREDRLRTGSRGLPNEPCATWADFSASQRLLPLARIARDEDALPMATIDALEALAGRLDELGGPPEPPARLHGDLWAGNRLIDREGRSWLIDPAAHGGHREFDLAMMRLFGGFGEACFAAYQEAHPLADGWADRVALHQLAPLVVHAIKFGGGYVGAAADAVRRYC